VLVGADGVARVVDFGVAKAAGRIHTTRDGQLKGKLAYMAPEQLRQGSVDRRTDVFAAGIVLWELLTLQRLFADESEGHVVWSVLERAIPAPSRLVAGLPKGIDAVTLRALDRNPDQRFTTAREMALALEAAMPVASPTRVSEWVEGLVGDALSEQARCVDRIENSSLASLPPTPTAAEPSAATEPSQVSSISVSTNSHRLSRPHARWLVFGVVAIGLAAFALGGLARFARRRDSDRGDAAAAVIATSDVSATAPNAETVQPPPAEPPTVSPTPSAAAPVSSARAPSIPRSRPPTQPKPCPIKSYLDESGIKHFVKDCK
jgi:serine/threonine-protein kinase